MALTGYYDRMAHLVDAIHVARGTSCLVSPPGEGKTAWVRETLAKREVDTFGNPISGIVITLLVSTMEGPDFAGALTISHMEVTNAHTGEVFKLSAEGTPVTMNATPAWVVTALSGEGVVYIFLDELNHGSPDVMGPLQTIVQDKIMPNGVKLGLNHRFIAAMNPRRMVNNANELSSAMTNRMTHIPFDVPFKDWIMGFVTNFGKPMSQAEMDARGKFAAYLRTNESVLNWDDAEDKTAGWSSKRSWDTAVRIFALNPPMLEVALAGTIGERHVAALMTYLEGITIPSPEEVWADIKVLDTLDAGLMITVLNSCVLHGIAENDPEMIGNILVYAAGDYADQAASVMTDHVSAFAKLTDKDGGPGLPVIINKLRESPQMAPIYAVLSSSSGR